MTHRSTGQLYYSSGTLPKLPVPLPLRCEIHITPENLRHSGYIQLHRKIQANHIWPALGGYFLDLALRAVFRATSVGFKNHFIRLAPGQFVTTYRVLAEDWSKPKTFVHDLLHRFEKLGMVRLQQVDRRFRSGRTTTRTTDGTVITVCNFARYNTLPDNAYRGPNDNPNENPNSQEEAVRSSTAARARARQDPEPPLADEGGPPGPGLPQELFELLDVLARKTGRAVSWPEEELRDLSSLINLGMDWRELAGRVLRIAERELTKGKIPSSLAYFSKAIRGDLAAEAQKRAESTLPTPGSPPSHQVFTPSKPEKVSEDAVKHGLAALRAVIGRSDGLDDHSEST